MKGADQFIMGGILTAMTLTEAVFSTPLGRLADKMGRKKTFYLITPIFCLANLLFVFAPSPEYLLVAGLLMGFRMLSMFAYGSMTPELVPSECIGRWRGLIGLFTGLVSIAAPIIGGLIWEHLGPGWVFIIPTLIDLFIRLPLQWHGATFLTSNPFISEMICVISFSDLEVRWNPPRTSCTSSPVSSFASLTMFTTPGWAQPVTITSPSRVFTMRDCS